MPELLQGMKQSVNVFNSELSTFKTKTLKVNRNICNLDEVTSTIQKTLQIQDDKIVSLDKLNKNSEAFVASTVLIDSNVADIINQSKDDFYNTYDYLKPNCEKSTWEKIKDSVTDAVEYDIGWNPFNSDVSLIAGKTKGQKVSFYKGMPVIRISLGEEGRSASFLAIWLAGERDADEINHEWGTWCATKYYGTT